MNRSECHRDASEKGDNLADLFNYAAASRMQAADAEARGNLPLARELKARAEEAEILGQKCH